MHVQEVARNHLREINNKIRELQALRRELGALLRRKVGGSTPNAVCPMIERAGAKRKLSDSHLNADRQAAIGPCDCLINRETLLTLWTRPRSMNSDKAEMRDL